jgi:hypothetical protein
MLSAFDTTGSALQSSETRQKGGNENGAPTTNRRQSRLQRNRESARLSRKRRKQYLETLEERVDQLSEMLDRSRRQHVAEAVTTISEKRLECILRGTPDAVKLCEHHLSRTSEELRIAITFLFQQLKSYSTPPSMQFILWLTLQTDAFFRGGRTASERLSAARIGERVSVRLSRIYFYAKRYDSHFLSLLLLLADAEQRNRKCRSIPVHVAPLLQ